MKLLSVTKSPIIIKPLKERWYEVVADARCLIKTDCGCMYFYIHKGWKFDGRSGGWLVDLIAANLGTQEEVWAFAVHDTLFYGFGITFETANDILRQQLRLDAKYGRIRANVIHWGVSTEFARKAFENNDEEEELNKQKLHFSWVDDQRGFMLAQSIDFTNNPKKLATLAESSIDYRTRWSK